MTSFPAIAIGGPPHSGKSVLTYGLTQLLREQHIDHYVLRACPDGEGDWSNEATPETVQAIRQKGQFSESFVQNVCQALHGRHLPLLVDVGGRPTPQDEPIFRQCTHLIIISSSPEGLTEWRAFAQRLGLPVIAELDSRLTGEERVEATYPLLRGQVVGLERGKRAIGVVMEHLAGVVRSLFAFKPDELRQRHLEMTPLELAVDLDRVAKTLNLMQGGKWLPNEIPAVLDYLPHQTPLAIYGRGTNWLYTALVLHTWPAEFYQFDPRLGWTKPARLQLLHGQETLSPLLGFHLLEETNHTRVKVQIPDAYLDYDAIQGGIIPSIHLDRGVILDGKLPYWLLTGLAVAYCDAPWLAVYQPQVGEVVVMSRVAHRSPGMLV